MHASECINYPRFQILTVLWEEFPRDNPSNFPNNVKAQTFKKRCSILIVFNIGKVAALSLEQDCEKDVRFEQR
jgi:hypothetical protein